MGDVSDNGDELVIDVEAGEPTSIRVRGDIDIDTSGSLRTAVEQALAGHPNATVVFDMAEVGFMDSSGLAILVNADNDGAHVIVTDPSPAARLAIEASGLNHLLEPRP